MADFESVHRRVGEIANREFFFIIGVPKSGTTWVQKLLNAHPDVSCNGESHVMNVLTPALCKTLTQHNHVIRRKNIMLGESRETGYPIFTNEHATFLAQCAFVLLLDAQLRGRDCRWIGEKTPDHMRHMDALVDLFPRCKFVHIIRDGRDCAVSGWHHVHRDTPEWAQQRFKRFHDYLHGFARGWASQIPPARAFGQTLPGRYIEIRYEDLKRETAPNTERLLAFLGADTSADVVAHCVEAASFKRLAKGRTPGEEDKSSFYRKGISGGWQEYFDDECLATFESIAGPLMRELGYSA